MKKIFSLLTVCLMASLSWGITIYESDLLQNGSGYTTAGNGSFQTSAVSWASAYPNYWKTTSSTHKTTLTFSPAIDLSPYSNVQMTVKWGHSSSNKPIKIFVNGTQITTVVSGTMTTSASNTLCEAVVAVTGSTINNIAFQGASSSRLPLSLQQRPTFTR